jgi:hypothetical protein
MTHGEEVREMQRAIPSRRLVTAILATIALTVAATPLVAADHSGSTSTSKPRSYCPPAC